VRNCVQQMLFYLLLFRFSQFSFLSFVRRLLQIKNCSCRLSARSLLCCYRLIGRRGPLRVRALVRVRWPRIGRPRL
jgi:hypothetical protein